MPSAAVHAAFNARLTANWTETPIVDSVLPIEPPQVPAFLVLQYPVTNASKPVLQRTYWEEGAARLVLNVDVGAGLTYGLGLADQLATLFREVKFDGVETFSTSPPILREPMDEGTWFELSVIVPYRFEFDS
jgi:hypothetical protein